VSTFIKKKCEKMSNNKFKNHKKILKIVFDFSDNKIYDQESYDKYLNEFSKIDINLIRGLIDLKDRAKDKDKDKDVLLNSKKSKDGKFSGNFKAQGEELFAQRFSTHGTVNKTRIENL
jgi:hypothetical protein